MPEKPGPLKGEQIELFSEKEKAVESDPYENKSNDELASLYQEHVGVKFRNDLSREQLIAVLKGPREDERARLYQIDRAEDKEELRRTYRR